MEKILLRTKWLHLLRNAAGLADLRRSRYSNIRKSSINILMASKTSLKTKTDKKTSSHFLKKMLKSSAFWTRIIFTSMIFSKASSKERSKRKMLIIKVKVTLIQTKKINKKKKIQRQNTNQMLLILMQRLKS